MYGRHHFALSAVKEVAVTPSFLSLPETTRKCQLNETLHGCQTRKYLELLSLSCHCLPANIKTETLAGVCIQISYHYHYHYCKRGIQSKKKKCRKFYIRVETPPPPLKLLASF